MDNNWVIFALPILSIGLVVAMAWAGLRSSNG